MRKMSLLECDGSQNFRIQKQWPFLPSPAEDSAQVLKTKLFAWQKMVCVSAIQEVRSQVDWKEEDVTFRM